MKQSIVLGNIITIDEKLSTAAFEAYRAVGSAVRAQADSYVAPYNFIE